MQAYEPTVVSSEQLYTFVFHQSSVVSKLSYTE